MMGHRVFAVALLVWPLLTATALGQEPAFRTAPIEIIFGGALDQAIANLDADSHLDLIFPTGQSGVVGVLYGRGDGSFEGQRDCASGLQPSAVAVGNFDNDASGFLDIAAVGIGAIAVLPGTGEHNCPTTAVQSTPGWCAVSRTGCETTLDCPPTETCESAIPSPASVAARDLAGRPLDLNGDSYADLVVANSEDFGNVALLFGQPDGTFVAGLGGPLAAGKLTMQVLAGDVNNDAQIDIVAVNRDSNDLSVLLNDGSGGFLPATAFPAGQAPRGGAAGDWNGDGNMDLVVANRDTNEFSLLVGDGSGAFGAPVGHPAGLQPADIAAGDFDGDGNLDVAVANRLSHDVTVAYGDGQGEFPRRYDFLSDEGTSGLLVGSLDGEAGSDIVAVNTVAQEGSTYTVLLSREDGSLEAPENISVAPNPEALTVGDINSDGRPDAVVVSEGSSSIRLLIARAAGFSTQALDVGAISTAASLVDVNADLHPDLLLSQKPAELAIYLGDGRGGFQVQQVVTLGTSLGDIAAGDLNEDGHVDVVVTEGDSDSVAVLLGHGDGTFATAQHASIRPDGFDGDLFPRAVAIEDLDGDKHLDLAVASSQDNGLLALRNGRGDGTFEEPTTLPAGVRPLKVIVSDVDDKLGPDLLTINEGTQAFLVFANTGEQTYAPPRAPSGGGGFAGGGCLRDVSGDGFRDAIIADRTSNRVRILRGGRTTAPFFQSVFSCPRPNCLTAGRTPVSAEAADFDDDGRYDIMAVNFGGANVTVFTSTIPAAVLRGDGNEDQALSAADVAAVMGALAHGANRRAVEDAVRLGQAATLAVDADGDGVVSPMDAIGVTARLFRG